MSMVAIITARGGSKRIPRKNIREFMGRPMLAYAIDAARGCGWFDEVMVSTDDQEIAAIALAHGAEVPFMRSAATADDHATTNDVIGEVLDRYAAAGRTFDSFCVVYPCVPLLTPELLRAAGGKFGAGKAEMLVSAVRFSYPVQRALVENAEGFASFREPENFAKRTQDLEPTYHDAGMFYFCRTEAFLRKRSMNVDRLALYELPEDRVQDIDTEADWRMAEIKYLMLER